MLTQYQLRAVFGTIMRHGTYLDVTMQQLCGMEILQRTKQLVHDVPLVDVLQNVCTENSVKIRLHVLEDEIYIPLILCLGHV